MISGFGKIWKKATSDRKLVFLLFLSVTFIFFGELFSAGKLPIDPNGATKIAFKTLSHIGDILLLAFIFGVVFDYNERL